MTADDYEDDDDDEGAEVPVAAAKQPLAAAKQTVSKLAEKASDVAGVSMLTLHTSAQSISMCFQPNIACSALTLFTQAQCAMCIAQDGCTTDCKGAIRCLAFFCWQALVSCIHAVQALHCALFAVCTPCTVHFLLCIHPVMCAVCYTSDLHSKLSTMCVQCLVI